MTYRVEFDPPAWRELMSLPQRVQERLFNAIERLEIEPRPSGVRKLQGQGDQYRIRVGAYRVLYEIQDALLVVTVIEVGDRKEVYQRR